MSDFFNPNVNALFIFYLYFKAENNNTNMSKKSKRNKTVLTRD